MSRRSPSWRRAAATLAACAAIPSAAHAPAEAPGGATALRTRHTQLAPSLERNAFGRPLHLESSERDGRLQGDVHAVLGNSFASVREALAEARSWCDILTLPFNVKRCEARGDQGISVFIGRTPQTPLEKAVRIDFRYELVTRSDDLLELRLTAPSGPLGTRDYRIAFEATPLDASRTFVHMSYGYAYGAVSRMAMQAYLATSGADKVGFSREPGGERLVGGMRGVLERNTMRYFLAIAAYLDTLGAAPQARLQRRLLAWFDAAERHPRQLHEMSRDEYVALKRRDLAPAS